MAAQLGNMQNSSVPAAVIAATEGAEPEVVAVEPPAPVRELDMGQLRQLGIKYKALFDRFASERLPAEQKWIKNLRQYLGVYDPDAESQLDANRSRAYPRLTRMKCISMLSRIMNLMFPGNEDNWELTASPSPEMSPEAVQKAVTSLMQELSQGGEPVPLTQELVDEAVRRLADDGAAKLSTLIKDQMAELGGSQDYDWIALNRKVVDSGIKYGVGVLEGPYVRQVQQSGWVMTDSGMPQPVTRSVYKPQYDHLPVWDFYPDMSARSLPGEGYFVRKVLGRSALRRLADRSDFFGRVIKQLIEQMPVGNYKARSWENDLRSMGLAVQAESTPTAASGREKYEVIVWKGPVRAEALVEAGIEVPEGMMADEIDAELWMVDNWVIKADINPWRKLGVPVRQVHIFNFDEDDTSPVGQGLPGIVRDSQLSICAATRMALDNASVTCGPNLEVNTKLLRPDQDLTSVQPYKIWYRDDDGPATQFPAVRELKFDGHLAELQGLVRMFLEFAEMETFIGPSTGGDFQKMPSEPMRTAAGASMLRGDAALPFKDIIRNYDTFTQSAIWSMVQFNRKFNPDQAPEGDYNVIARGATSLIAKEVRGMQIDMLSQTLTPDELDHVDDRKLVEAKFASRDMQGMLVSEDVAKRRKDQRGQVAAQQAERQDRLLEAQIRGAEADAFKSISQGQKNAAGADQTNVKSAIEMMNAGANDGSTGEGGGTGNKAA